MLLILKSVNNCSYRLVVIDIAEHGICMALRDDIYIILCSNYRILVSKNNARNCSSIMEAYSAPERFYGIVIKSAAQGVSILREWVAHREIQVIKPAPRQPVTSAKCVKFTCAPIRSVRSRSETSLASISSFSRHARPQFGLPVHTIPMPDKCWASVADAGPTLIQH